MNWSCSTSSLSCQQVVGWVLTATFFIEGKKISWSAPPLLFSCLTIHLCSLPIDPSGTVSQLNFMYVSLVFSVSPSWESRTALLSFSFQYTFMTSGKNFSRRQRYVPVLWRFVSAEEGRKMVGLGEMSALKLLSAGITMSLVPSANTLLQPELYKAVGTVVDSFVFFLQGIYCQYRCRSTRIFTCLHFFVLLI